MTGLAIERFGQEHAGRDLIWLALTAPRPATTAR
jgi:hypothetical protein